MQDYHGARYYYSERPKHTNTTINTYLKAQLKRDRSEIHQGIKRKGQTVRPPKLVTC